MKSGEEIRIFAYGTELELRPVNAEGYLESRRMAAEYSEKFGGDYEAEKAAFLAGLLYRSAYDGENRFFVSEEDVLQKLTAAELSEYGSMLYNGEIWDGISFEYEISEKDSAERKYENSPQSDYYAGTKGKIFDTVPDSTLNVPENRPVVRESFAVDRRTVVVNETLDEKAAAEKTAARKYYRASGISMERISDFFQRDSRRYDGYKR